MSRYTVQVEASDEASDEAVDALISEVQQHSGVVAGGPGFSSLSVTITVEADTPVEAVSRGVDAVSEAAAKSGLGVREFIRCEAALLEKDLARFPRR